MRPGVDHNKVNYDLPEKDCVGSCSTMFRQPEQKSSSESSDLCNVSRLYTRSTLHGGRQHISRSFDILIEEALAIECFHTTSQWPCWCSKSKKWVP